MGLYEPTVIEVHQAPKLISQVRSLYWEIKTISLLEEIASYSNEVFQHFESDIAVRLRNLANTPLETAESYVKVTKHSGPYISTSDLQAKKSNLYDLACIIVKLYTSTYQTDWPCTSEFGKNPMHFIAV